MKTISLELSKDYIRPVIELYDMSAIIDTGAMIPTISLPHSILVDNFDAKLVLPQCEIGGFGGQCSGKVFALKEFQIGELIYAPFEVFVPDEPELKHPILLSASMFYGMEYTIDTVHAAFIVRIAEQLPLKREFRLRDLDGKLYAQIAHKRA